MSVDQLLNLPSDALLFTGKPQPQLSSTLEGWLTNLMAQLQLMASFSQRHVTFLVKDIPPFYHFQIPELAEFKFFFWQKSILHYDALKGGRFQFGSPDYTEAHALSQRIVALYQLLPTTEIWNVESLNSTLRQIEFYHDSGFFASPEVAHTLYQKVGELIDGIEAQAELGLKCVVHQPLVPHAASYRLFVNEFILGDNTFLAELGDMRLIYLNHSVLHVVGTRDESFNDFMFANLQNLLKKSTRISGVSEKERNRSFNTLRDSIRQRLHHARPVPGS